MAEVPSGAVNAGALNTHAFNEIAPALLYGAGAVVAASAVPTAAVAKRVALAGATRNAVYAVDLNNGNNVAGQGVQIPHHGNLMPSSVSIEFWFELTGPLDVDANNNWRSFIRKGGTSSTQTGWDVVLEQAGWVQWDTGHGTTDRLAASAGIVAGDKNHFVFTYDAATGVKKVFKNGVLIASKTAPTGGLSANTSDIFIGYGTNHVTNPNGAGDSPGKFDGVRYYSRALSDAEVAEHYQGVYNDESGLLARWEFDEGTGGVVTDASGNGHNGTLIGSPGWVPGIVKADRVLAAKSTTLVASVTKQAAVSGAQIAALSATPVASMAKRNALSADVSAPATGTAHQTLGLVVSTATAAVVTSSASMAKRNVLMPSAVAAQSFANSLPVHGSHVLEFAGSGAGTGIEVAETPELNLQTYTYELWFLPFTGYDGTWREFIRRIEVGIVWNDRLSAMWMRPNDNRVHFRQGLVNGTDVSVATVTPLTLGRWHHLAFSCYWDGAQTRLRAYINGVLEGQVVYSSEPLLAVNAAKLFIGRYANCRITELRVWNYERTAAQIQASMHDRLLGTEAGLVAYWPLDEGAGSTAGNRASANDGTIAAGATWVESKTRLTKRAALDSSIAVQSTTPDVAIAKRNALSASQAAATTSSGQVTKQAAVGATVLPVSEGQAAMSKRGTFGGAVASSAGVPDARMSVVISGQLVGTIVAAASSSALMAKRATMSGAPISAASAAPTASVAKHQALSTSVAAATVVDVAGMAKRAALGAAPAGQSAVIQALVSKWAGVRGVEVGRLTVAAHSTLGHVVRALSEAYSSVLARDVALIQVGGAGPVWPARERRSVWVLVARPTTWTVAHRKKRVGRAAAAVGPAPSIFVQTPLRERTSSAFNVGPVLGAVVGG